MIYEKHNEPILSRAKFLSRMALHGTFALGILILSLLIGIVGYHFTENLSWIDALLNACMLLGGMGPVNPIQTIAGKLFASFYALFSGMVFLVAVGVLFTPLFHRFLHRFHLGLEEDGS